LSSVDLDLLTDLKALLQDTNYEETLEKSNHDHICEYFSNGSVGPKTMEHAKKAARTWELFATDALSERYGDLEDVEKWWEKAFICRRAAEYKTEEADLEDIFYFAVTGLVNEEVPQVRVILENIDLPDISTDTWDERLQDSIMKATILLIRKSGGWKDISEAREIIEQLHEEQREHEKEYLDGGYKGGIPGIVALYNITKIVDLSIQYVTEGSPSGILDKIDRFSDNASQALDFHNETDISLIHDMVYLGCKNVIENSLWFQTRSLATGQEMGEYIENLIEREDSHPIFELMPSQQKALSQESLSTYQRAIVLNMPTSAGKTMMAEFSIVQSKSLNEESTVIYLVPTRALVNQTTISLRRKLSKIGLNVESAVPAFELDPTEDEFLQGEIDVLVSTPEKLDLLLKEGHPAVSDISLVVADEAHNIEEGSRGANLELLLSTINREFDNVRFLLLSPFIPNSDEIAKWLGKDQSNSITVEWRATDQVTGISRVRKHRNGPEYVELNIVPSSTTRHINDEFSLELDGQICEEGNRGTKKKSSASTALNLVSDDGTVLILCMTRKRAIERAREIIPYLDRIEMDDEVKLVLDFVKEELGADHFLVEMLEKGVGVHHSGIPMEIRCLIERLAEQGKIKVLTATTTLAQGVNFPIKHIVLEGTYLPAAPPQTGQYLSHNQFWNIAGRAGRAFEDHMGGILFAAGKKSDFDDYKGYLKSDADKVLSSLRTALTNLEEIQGDFNLNFARTNEEFASFIRYILHTVNVSSYQSVQSNLEDVLRSSLIYYQLEGEDPELADKLIDLTKSYLDDLGVISQNEEIIDLIDRTGFTSMSVEALFAREDAKNLHREEVWNSDLLFDRDTNNLTKVLDVLKDIPEVDLGRFIGDDLDVNAISGIVKEWVNGSTLEEISDMYFEQISNKEERIIKASSYVNKNLMGFVSWGMSALQKVSAFGHDELDLEQVGHVPAMVFYGVNSREAAALRMVDVPRNLAEGLGSYYGDNFEEQPSFSKLRDWLEGLDSEVWEEASEFENIGGDRAQKLWKILNGLE